MGGWAKGEAQPKDSVSVEKFAQLVLDDVVGTEKGGLIADYLLSQTQGLNELSQELAKGKSI
ncbi:hypothetical protein M426DRAFT_15495 [Hypoxylon sp. CI-4A]|nr:hypothetical protein M426DRAFT_15495 [Hypoxylon sp. CI-4A]